MEGGGGREEKHPLLRMKKGSEERVSVQRHKESVVEISLGTVYQPHGGNKPVYVGVSQTLDVAEPQADLTGTL